MPAETVKISHDCKYSNAISLLNHYSHMRTMVLSFMSPIILGSIAFIVKDLENIRLVLYLLIFELFLSCCLYYTSRYFSKRIRLMKRVCARFESGEDVNWVIRYVNALENVADDSSASETSSGTVGRFPHDVFDTAILISVGAIQFLVLIFFLESRLLH